MLTESPPAPTLAAPLAAGPVPLYHQVRLALRQRILSGEWQPGGQIPTIRELCEMYGVSRITVVQALSALTREGLVAGRQGKGVFVAEPRVEHGPGRLVSFTEETQRRGHSPASRMLRLERQPASELVAERLNVPEDSSVVVLERLRLADGEPMGFQRAYLPESLVPGLADCADPIESLYRLLEGRYGIRLASATDTFVPTRLSREMADLLAVPVGALAFAVERVSVDGLGRTVEFVESILRGDRYKVVLRLNREDL